MKKGFNKYDNMGGEEDSNSEPSNPPTPNNNHNHQPQNYSMINQFANFSPGSNGFSDTMIVTLFQIVEQQSQALQSLMRKVEVITERTVELTEKIK
jgi:hypothetical protein